MKTNRETNQKIPANQKILAAALTVIRTKGYAGTTVDDLCESAGITKGAFFHHFKSKEDMAVAAANHWTKITSELFAHSDYQKLNDPLDRFLGYIDLRAKLLRGNTPDFTCFVGTMVQEIYDTHPAIREACKKSIFEHAATIAKDIEAAKKLYVPKATWNSESLALHTQAVIQGAFILAKSKESANIAADSIAHLRRYIEFLFDQSKNKKPRERK